MKAVAAHLDALSHGQRVAAIEEIDASQQKALWAASKGFAKITIENIVPSNLPPMREVIHWGRNTLPIFKLFQKRFCRPDDPAAARAGELWGYNEQTFGLFTGPGYFVAYDLPGGEVLVDYTRLPPRGADGWPEVIPNSARLSRFIYNGTKDTLRGVSRHVTIGRAARDGKDMPNWFVLCREDPRG